MSQYIDSLAGATYEDPDYVSDTAKLAKAGSSIDYGDLSSLLGSGVSLYNNRGGSAEKTSPELQAALAMLLQGADSNKKDFSKEAAINDSQAAVAAIFKDFKNTALPKIYGAQTASGGYNSTGAQLLANDAYGSAVAKAAELKLKTISEYERNKTQQLEQLTRLLGTQATAQRPTSSSSSASNSNTSDIGNILKIGSQLMGLF